MTRAMKNINDSTKDENISIEDNMSTKQAGFACWSVTPLNPKLVSAT
jgi:hypothetical protein